MSNRNQQRLARGLQGELDIPYTMALRLVRTAADTDRLPVRWWQEPARTAAIGILTEMYEAERRPT